MIQPPRPFAKTFFNWKELTTSLVQGVVITCGTLFIYQYSIGHGYAESVTRTMVFVTLVTANIFLTLVNRSFLYSIAATMKYKNNMVPAIISLTIVLTGMILYISPLTAFFRFAHPAPGQLLISMGIGCLCVVWYELVKWVRRIRHRIPVIE